MPPCVYREGITEDATFRYYDTVIARIARPGLRLYLYHFPGISGVPVTPQVVRRLDERHPGIIAGVKDFGRRRRASPPSSSAASRTSRSSPAARRTCPTSSPQGARGTICGLANVMPRLMRALIDAPTAFDRRALPAGAPAGRRHPLAPPVHPLGQGGASPTRSATPSGAG